MVLVENGLNSEQISLMRPIYIKIYFGTERSGLNSEGGLNFVWSLLRNLNNNNKCHRALPRNAMGANKILTLSKCKQTNKQTNKRTSTQDKQDVNVQKQYYWNIGAPP